MARKKPQPTVAKPLPPALASGRPLYFAQKGAGPCALCQRMGLIITHTGTIYMNDPANSPLGDESVYTVCKGHLPSNVVIFEPETGRTYDKNGEPTSAD